MLTASGLTGQGLDVLWTLIVRHREVMSANGARAARRADQDARWMWAMVRDRLEQSFRTHPDVAGQVPMLEASVRAGDLPALHVELDQLAFCDETESAAWRDEGCWRFRPSPP